MSTPTGTIVNDMGIIAAALIRRDGTLEDIVLPVNMDKDTFAILCATIHASALKIYNEIGYQAPSKIALFGKDANLFIFPNESKNFWAILVPVTMDPDQVINDFLTKVKSKQ